MTRLPTESRDYKGLDGPGYESYKVGPMCSVPECNKYADHSHHLVRRSELGGPFLWVRMPDGREVGNLAALCFLHHNEVTENKARITYKDNGTGNYFFWTGSTMTDEPLVQQPPIKGTEHVFAEDHDREECPTCHRKLPKPKIETEKEEKKPRGTWAIAIPIDERENGADTLDSLLEACQDELDKVGISYGDGNRVKFYILSTSLGLLVQHFDKVVADD